MNKYKEMIRKRTIILIAILIIMLAIYLALYFSQDSLGKSSDKMISYHGGALLSFSILLIVDIIKDIRAFKNENQLKKLYIKENDEREILIMQKTGAVGINICILGLAVATIIAGYFNEIVFLTLLGSTLFVALIKGLFKIYYHRKI